MSSSSHVITPADLAARWQVSDTAVYDLLNRGTLQGFRIGRLWRIRVCDVEAYECLPHSTTRNEAPVCDPLRKGSVQLVECASAKMRTAVRLARLEKGG